MKSMEAVGSSRDYPEIASPVNNEVGMMATHINNMVHKLEEADRRTHDAEEIGALAVATAGIFRHAVRSDRGVKLRDELTCAREYMTIMQIRFPGRYLLALRVPEECPEPPLCRMLLQPIVENCFKHGFAGKSGLGRIHIGVDLGAVIVLKALIQH